MDTALVVGPRRIQKSTTFEVATVGMDIAKIDGNTTAFGAYQILYEHQNRPVIIDDVDGVFASPAWIKLLKPLCDTKPIKRIAWINDRTMRCPEDVPPFFFTRAPTVLIANTWFTQNEDVAAVQDRGHCLYFNPPPWEVHLRTAAWFDDQEIYDFVGMNLHSVGPHLSMRAYVLAREIRKAGKDWKKRLLSNWLQGPELLAARLLADPSYPTDKARIEVFEASGGGCGTTFKNIKARLQFGNRLQVPQITLKNRPATGDVSIVPFSTRHAPCV